VTSPALVFSVLVRRCPSTTGAMIAPSIEWHAFAAAVLEIHWPSRARRRSRRSRLRCGLPSKPIFCELAHVTRRWPSGPRSGIWRRVRGHVARRFHAVLHGSCRFPESAGPSRLAGVDRGGRTSMRQARPRALAAAMMRLPVIPVRRGREAVRCCSEAAAARRRSSMPPSDLFTCGGT